MGRAPSLDNSTATCRTATEREARWRIRTTRQSCQLASLDLPTLTATSDTFTSAAIEQDPVDAHFDGLAAEPELTQSLLLAAVRRTVPPASTVSEDITRLRN